MELDIEKIVLGKGKHASIADGACVMEIASYLAHEPWSDSPKCACPVIAGFLRSWNDALPDDQRQMLKPYAKKVLNTRSAKAVEGRRARMARDWLVRVYAPAWLDLAGHAEEAATLRRFSELTTAVAFKDALPALNRAEEKARAAWSAAWSAAESAAESAARSAAESAARSAARSAAWSAAWSAAESAAESAARSAARSAAESAARSAADAKLAPVTKEIQRSALTLLDRMIAEGK